jgi:hypothetical protein
MPFQDAGRPKLRIPLPTGLFPVTQEHPTSYREMGRKLAAILRDRDGNALTPGALQGIAADIVGSNNKLLLPVKHLLATPGFRSLITKAGSGKGMAEIDALLQDIQDMFSPHVATALKNVLFGFVALEENNQVHISDVRETVIDEASHSFHDQHRQESHPPLATVGPDFASNKPRAFLPSSVKHVLFIFVFTLLAVGAYIATKAPSICNAIGLCSSTKFASSEQLRPISKADQIDRELLLAAHRSIESARDASGSERLELLMKASKSLDGVGMKSPAALDVANLRQRIEAIKLLENSDTSSAAAPVQRERFSGGPPKISIPRGGDNARIFTITDSTPQGLKIVDAELIYNDGDSLVASFRVYCPTSLIRPTNFILKSSDGLTKKEGSWWEPAFRPKWEPERSLIRQACP